MSAYFDGCYFDPAYFDASECVTTPTVGRHVRGRNRRPFIPLLPEPPPVDDAEDAIERERVAARALVAAVVGDATLRVLKVRRRREDEWLLGLEEAA